MQSLETRYGQLSVPDNADDLIIKFLARYGEWAWLEVEFVARHTPPAARVIDIGSFIGTFGLGLAQATGNLGSIVFCEANPQLFPILATNAKNLCATEYHLILAAIGASPTSLIGRMTDDNLGALSFAPDASGNRLLSATHYMSLKQLRARFGPFDVIKIDAEGMEKTILSSDAEFLAAEHPTLWLECLETPDSLELASWLLSIGYHLQYFSYSAFNPHNFRKNSDRIFPVAFEAGLLATRAPLEQAKTTSQVDQTFTRSIKCTADLREALWLTPRWAPSGLETLPMPNLVALAARHHANQTFETFLQEQAKGRTEHTDPTLDKSTEDPSFAPSITDMHDNERNQTTPGSGTFETALVEQSNALKDQQIAALTRGRNTLLSDLETLRIQLIEQARSHEQTLLRLTTENEQLRSSCINSEQILASMQQSQLIAERAYKDREAEWTIEKQALRAELEAIQVTQKRLRRFLSDTLTQYL